MGCGFGALIAYASDEGSDRAAIRVAGADGSNPIQLTHPASIPGDPARDHSPSWSPDGRRIVFTRAWQHPAGNGTCQIVVINADGSNAVQLTNDSFCAHAPAWSPDGNKIVFNGKDDAGGPACPGCPSNSRRFGIKLINPDGTGEVFVREARYGWPSRVAWGPPP
jgi:Tol biopolymer transport system component